MKFGEALEWAKKGYRISRYVWNMAEFVVYQKGYPNGIPCNAQTAAAFGMNVGDKFVCNPYLQKHNSNETHTMWIPSVDDILAVDWLYIDADKGADFGDWSVPLWGHERNGKSCRYFISQPMGDSTLDAISELRKKIRANVHKFIEGTVTIADDADPIIPWEIDSLLDPVEAMASSKNPSLYVLGRSIQLLSTADLLVCPFLAPDDMTRGCRIEYECATRYGIEIVQYNTDTGELVI